MKLKPLEIMPLSKMGALTLTPVMFQGPWEILSLEGRSPSGHWGVMMRHKRTQTLALNVAGGATLTVGGPETKLPEHVVIPAYGEYPPITRMTPFESEV